jgi:hypothetical protein
MELLLYSPSVKVLPSTQSVNHALPVFGDHDVVGGKVILDPSCQAGRLMLTVSSCCHSTNFWLNVTSDRRRLHVQFDGEKR